MIYHAVDYEMGRSTAEITNELNSYGALGWQLVSVEIIKYNMRRAVFVEDAPAEYLVVDYDAGKTAETLEADLNVYGADGWNLNHVDLARSNVRRAIFMRGGGSNGGGGGSDPDAMHWVPYMRPAAVVCRERYDPRRRLDDGRQQGHQ